MAENLGEAQLQLTVNTDAVDKELKRLRDAIQNFAPDFKAVRTGLRTVAAEAKVAAESTKSLAFNLNQIPSSKLEGLSRQIKALQSNLRGARIQSEDFLQALTRIQELQGLRDIRVGRQSAIAGQQAYSPEGALGRLSQSQLPQLPLTLAGERQNIDELKKKLSNLDYESAAYAETLRVLQGAQERYNNILNGTSAEYQKLAQQEEAAIRRAEKLAGIQSYYSDKNPRAGGVRDEGGAMLARGAGSAADERAYQAALRPARELLAADLKRAQVLREISQRILATANASEGGFGAASASNFGTTDPVTKSIRRNAERAAQRLESLANQREALESDLIDVQRRRLASEERSLKAIERGREIGRLNAVDINGRLPGGGFVPGSPGAINARNRQLREAGSNALIGGAFPALFGQGLGASVGGALGGGAGGLVGGQFGFGLSLLGTALGAQLDLATQKLQTLGSALSDPVKQFSALTEAGLISSKGLEKQIQALIDTGREAEAAALIQKDLASTYGDLQVAKDLAAENDKLARTYTQLQTRLAEFVAGPLARFVELVNRGLGGSPGTNENGVGFTSFRRQVDQIGQERGRSVAADLVRRQLAEEGRIASRDRGSAILGDLTFGLFGKGKGARSEEAAKTVLDQAAAEGIITREQAKQNSLQAAAKQSYAELNTLAYQQIAAQAQGNKELELSLRKRQIELQLSRDLALLNDSNDPGFTRRQALFDKAKQDIFALDEQLKTLNNGSLTDLQDRLATLNGQQLRVSVDSSTFAAANKQILETQNAIEQLDGKKATITVEQINAGVQDGSLTNNFSNLEKRAQAAQQALNTAPFGSAEFNKALRDTQAANFELDQRRKLADPNALSTGLEKARNDAKEAQEKFKSDAEKALDDVKARQEQAAADLQSAFSKAQQAAESLAQAQNSYRSALEGSFDLLGVGVQGELVSAARKDLARAVNAGLFDSGKVGNLSDKQTISAGAQARQVLEARANAGKAQDALVNSNLDLTKATSALAEKDWTVNVAVNASSGDYAVNLG